MAIEMKSQTELAEEMAYEFAACGGDDITVFQILDVLASTGISLIENSFLNLASEELHQLLSQGIGNETI
jgi:hypothetical protein